MAFAEAVLRRVVATWVESLNFLSQMAAFYALL